MPVQTSYPGVYIEERRSGVPSIVGVSTSTTAFVGACSFGPVATPIRVTSVAAYNRQFGPSLGATEPMGHMVGHYFANGGSEAIIVRVAGAGATPATTTLLDGGDNPSLILDAASPGTWANRDGSAGLSTIVDHAASNPADLFNLIVQLRSVNPATGNVDLVAEERYENLSMSPANSRYVATVLAASGLVATGATSPAPTSTAAGTSTGLPLPTPISITAGNNTLRVAVDHGSPVDLILDAGDHNRGELRDAIDAAATAAGLALTVTLDASNRLVLTSDAPGPDSMVSALPAPNDASASCLLGLANGGTEASGSAALRPIPGTTTFASGTSGSAVTAANIVPPSGTGGIYSLASRVFPRFNLLVLPGVTSDDQQEVGAALAYCRGERAFLLVDTPPETNPGDWVTSPPALGSIPAQGEHGAIYYPRLQVFETRPGGRRDELDLPPTGAIAGVYAATDRDRGVWKAPAGRGAGIVGISGLTTPTDDDLSGQLNPRGVNVLRSFPGAGTVVWGGRTLRGDDNAGSEFKYVPIRRLTDFIASSLYLGTAFAVFEPNDPNLWGQLRLAVNTFMKRLFDQGAFQQSPSRSAADSFFVVCDETVNPQAEIDLGRVNVMVGFAPLKPAEFVIVTITQISED